MRAIWNSAKVYILNYIKSAAFKQVAISFIKKVITYIFKNAAFTGFQTWLIRFFVKNIMINKALEPLVKKVFIELEYTYDVLDGNILIKKKDKAKDENNQNDYDDIVDDILG